jgi:c-di-GMP-binding flagellar brake protein YcgR
MIHFEPGQHVRLAVPELGGVSGQVLEVGDGQMIIALFLNGQGLPAAIEYPGVTLEYTAVRGLYRRLGTVRFDIGGVETIRFVAEGEAELVQRRGYARVDVTVPVTVKPGGVDQPFEVESVNLSGSGALLARPPLGAPPLDEGTRISLEISISDDEEPIEATGTVLRTLDDGSKGLHFDYITDGHRDRLVRFLFERQRLMRQAGRED